MKSKKSLLENLSAKHKDAIEKLDDKTLELILKSREIAVEYARKGITQTEPEKLNNDHIELIADSMKVLARIVLEERGILRKS